MDIMEQIEQMSEAEIKQLLETDFGTDLEKEASAELAQQDLAEALYAYGALMADKEVESQEELSKEASAEFEAAQEEITSAVEAGLMDSGILDTEDTADLHKQAQAAAGIIFAGYADQIEKLANDEGKMGKMKKFLSEKKEKALEAGKKAVKHVGANKGKYGLGAAGLAAAGGAYAYKKHHEKKASEITASELAGIVQEEQYINSVISEGINKLATAGAAAKPAFMAKAKEIAKKVMEGSASKVKTVKQYAHANPGKTFGAGAALGGAVGLAASKKEK